MKNSFKQVMMLIILLGCGVSFVMAQPRSTLELTEAYTLAEANYPLMADSKLIDEIAQINIELIEKERLPTCTGNFEGKIQSENIQIGDSDSPIQLDVPRESFNLYHEIDYKLYDGGLTSSKKAIEEANRQVNQQSLKVSLRTLKDRVNSLFFTIQLARQQKALLKTSMEDIQANIETLQAGYDNGTVLESELSKLKVRKLELGSDESSLEGDIQAYFAVLAALLGTPISSETELVLPSTSVLVLDGNISRPEQSLYDYQEKLLTAQEGIISASRRPIVSLFGQAGVGYPNPLNFADTRTSPYALGGLRVRWEIFDWGTAKKEKAKIEAQKRQVEVNRQTFEFDIASREEEFRQKITALEQQLANDKQIVTLQENILEQTATQLRNGIIQSNDYLIQVNAELAARQALELHTVQLQQLQIEYLTLFGKL